MGQKIDCIALSDSIRESLKDRIAALGRKPRLCVISVGDDPASAVYVRNKQKACEQVGIDCEVVRANDREYTTEEIVCAVKAYSKACDGIMVQLPLPPHIDKRAVLDAIPPEKDVDGLTAVNMGRLVTGQKCFEPCTPKGIIRILESTGEPLEGKSALVIGRSDIVGKPLAHLLMQRNATVTVAHSKTAKWEFYGALLDANIIVDASGKAQWIEGYLLSGGQTIIDVNICRDKKGRLCGGFTESCRKDAAYYTTVPGGVGPMTVTMLLENTVEAAERSQHEN